MSESTDQPYEGVNRQALTPAQQRVLDFLYYSGWATSSAIADHLYGNRRHAAGRAALIVGRLRDAGLVEPYLQTAWHLTDTGVMLFKARP